MLLDRVRKFAVAGMQFVCARIDHYGQKIDLEDYNFVDFEKIADYIDFAECCSFVVD